MPPPQPEDDVVLRCWELHTQHYSLRQIAKKLADGKPPIHVTHNTVRNYIIRAREMVRYVDHMDQAREYLTAGESLKQWEVQLREEMLTHGGTIKEYLPLYLQLFDRYAKLLGFGISPEMFAGLMTGGPPLDPKTVEMVKEVRDRTEKENPDA